MSRPTQPLLPIEPLERYIAQHGDLRDFFPQEEIWVYRKAKGGPFGDKNMLDSENHGYSTQRVHPDSRLEFERNQRRIERARKSGFIDLYLADEICCKVLGVHPVVVFGDAWFATAEDDAEQEVAA